MRGGVDDGDAPGAGPRVSPAPEVVEAKSPPSWPRLLRGLMESLWKGQLLLITFPSAVNLPRRSIPPLLL